MIKPNSILAIPTDVIVNYSKFISDKEFLAILHVGATGAGKDGLIAAAANMGYKDTGPLMNLLKDMASRGYITIDKDGVDVMPLWTMCQTPTKPLEPKPTLKKENTHYRLGGAVKQYSNYNNLHRLAGVIKPLLSRYCEEQIYTAYTILPTIRDKVARMTPEDKLVEAVLILLNLLEGEIDDLKAYVNYCYTMQQTKNPNNPIKYWDLVNWFDRWVELGKPQAQTSGNVTVDDLMNA